MLSVAYRGISIPLFWAVLDLEGNSCFEDRISILKRVLQQFGHEKIEALLADREFVGKRWFHFLIENRIPFIIRIKQNFKVELEDKCTVTTGQLRKKFGKRTIVNCAANLWGLSLHISVEKRKGAKEAMIIASNCTFADPLQMYRRRWEIETLFGCLKTRGFCMEETHIIDADKIEKLVFVLAVAFCWAYRIGDIQNKVKPIPLKTHGRKARSLFREGLNVIRRIFLNESLREFRKLLRCFAAPIWSHAI